MNVKFPDIFRLNNWQNKKFIYSILIFLLIFDALFFLNKYILNIPILLPLCGFILLTFTPGYIILKILRVHNIDRSVTLLLAVGLSLSFIMIFGLTINIILPFVGVIKPISEIPLLLSFNGVIFVLLLFSYLRDSNYIIPENGFYFTISPFLLFLFFLPLFGVFGAYLMTMYNSNILIIILLFLISIFPILIAFKKIPENLYPLTIFVIGISILFHVAMISMHIWSFDIFFESYSSNVVLENGIWNPNFAYGSHSLLPFTLLVPAYSLFCKLSMIWVIKIILPFIFSLAPVALFLVYQNLGFKDINFNKDLALFSIFIFIFFYGFFKDMPDKQHIAEFFLALLLLLIVTKIENRTIIAIILSFSLIVSHYGVSYVFLIALFLVLFIKYLKKVYRMPLLITLNFVMLFAVLSISWYIFVSSRTQFEAIVNIGHHVLTSIMDILQPDARSGVSYLLYDIQSFLWLIYKILHILLQLLIGVGIIKIVISYLRGKVESFDIFSLIVAFSGFLLIQISITYGMGFDRVLQICLLLLSPLAIIGWYGITSFINRIFNLKEIPLSTKSTKFLAIFLAIFFLFNSGFIFSITKDVIPPYAIALDRKTWEGWFVFNDAEISSSNWLREFKDNGNISTLYTDFSKDGMILAEHFRYSIDYTFINEHTSNLPPKTYIFFDKSIIKNNSLPIWSEKGTSYTKLDETDLSKKILNNADKIFQSSENVIFYMN